MKELRAVISDEEFATLEHLAQDLGVSLEELVRRSLTAYLAQAAMTWAVLYATHLLGDHALQKSAWAEAKHRPDAGGRAACATHVAVLTLTQLVGLAFLAVTAGAGYLPAAVAAAITASRRHRAREQRDAEAFRTRVSR
jgi:hypothetical protein